MTKSRNDVGEMLPQPHSEQKQHNGRMLTNIMHNVQFLGWQGIALRGHNEGESNFIQLMKLRCHTLRNAVVIAHLLVALAHHLHSTLLKWSVHNTPTP